MTKMNKDHPLKMALCLLEFSRIESEISKRGLKSGAISCVPSEIDSWECIIGHKCNENEIWLCQLSYISFT